QLQQSSPGAAIEPTAPRRTYARLTDRVRLRWNAARLVEVASVGWVLGLVPAALVIAWGVGAAGALIPLLAAAVAIAVGWRPVSAEAAADRVDATFGTRELFGTTLRLRDTADGAWLAATADSTAHRLAA